MRITAPLLVLVLTSFATSIAFATEPAFIHHAAIDGQTVDSALQKHSAETIAVTPLAKPHDKTAPALSLSAELLMYRFQLPTFMLPVSLGPAHLGTVGNPIFPSDPSTDYNFNRYGPMPALTLDYRFTNPHRLTAFMGDRLHLLTRFEYQNIASTTRQPFDSNTVFIWHVTESIYPFNDARPTEPLRFQNQTLQQKNQYMNLAVMLSGEKTMTGLMALQPRVGFGVTSLEQQYDYNIDTLQWGTLYHATVAGIEKVKSFYAGPLVGARLSFDVSSHVLAFLDAQYQALHAYSVFNADQSAASGLFTADTSVKSTKALYTYRTQMAIGIHYYLHAAHNTAGPVVGLTAGIDLWGYVPGVVNPHAVSAQEAHIERHTALNHYAALTMTVPLA